MRSWGAVLAGAVVLVASYLPGFGWGEAAGVLVVAGAMGLIVARSRAAGPALVVMVAGLYFVVSYGVTSPRPWSSTSCRRRRRQRCWCARC